MNKKVIHTKNLPTKLPLGMTLIIITMLKVWDVQGIWLGVVATILALMWVVAIYAIAHEDHTDIFDK